ncbi:hypothetical protein TNCV_3988881, partial [Trichonephila clavipes]
MEVGSKPEDYPFAGS